MSGTPLSIPQRVLRAAELRGPDAVEWLDDVPDLLAAAERRFHVELGYITDNQSEAVVARGRRGQSPIVLKLFPPNCRYGHERVVLEAAGGRGYVKVLDADDSLQALLLEPFGAELDAAEALERLGTQGLTDLFTMTLAQAWTVPLDAVATTGQSPAERLRKVILENPPPADVPDCARAVDRALMYTEQRREHQGAGGDVIVHGNPTLRHLRRIKEIRPGAESGFVLVEPDGFPADREYDLGALLRDAHRPLLAAPDPVVLAREWCARLAEASGTDAELIWQWAYVQRVARGLELVNGPEPVAGRGHLQAATALISRWRG